MALTGRDKDSGRGLFLLLLNKLGLSLLQRHLLACYYTALSSPVIAIGAMYVMVPTVSLYLNHYHLHKYLCNQCDVREHMLSCIQYEGPVFGHYFFSLYLYTVFTKDLFHFPLVVFVAHTSHHAFLHFLITISQPLLCSPQ